MNPFPLLVTALVLPAAAHAAEPVFVAQKADGTEARGALRELGPDRTLTLADKAPTRLAADDWLSLRRADKPLPPLPAGPHLALVNGDRVPCRDVRLTGETLAFRHPDLEDGKDAALPLSALAYLWLAAPDDAADAEALRHRLAREKRAKDRVLLRNGDLVEGTLESLDAKRVALDVRKQLVELPLDKVAVVALATDAPAALTPKGGASTQVTLLGGPDSHGTRVSLKSVSAAEGRVEGVTVFGAKLRVPAERVAAVDVLGGRAVYLSALKPKAYTFTPYLGPDGPAWPLAADASVAGRDLRLGGASYPRGLGMHARAAATYDLAGGYEAFEALVGLDDATGAAGSVRVRVLGDGKVLGDVGDRELTAKGGPRKVRVAVGGVKELTLEVDFGARANEQDHVNWADARLVKGAKAP